MKFLDFFPAVCLVGFLAIIALTVYNVVEIKHVEKTVAHIPDWDSRHDAFYKTWRKKHSIMPCSSPDVAYFASLGFIVPVGIFYAVTFLLEMF